MPQGIFFVRLQADCWQEESAPLRTWFGTTSDLGRISIQQAHRLIAQVSHLTKSQIQKYKCTQIHFHQAQWLIAQASGFQMILSLFSISSTSTKNTSFCFNFNSAFVHVDMIWFGCVYTCSLCLLICLTFHIKGTLLHHTFKCVDIPIGGFVYASPASLSPDRGERDACINYFTFTTLVPWPLLSRPVRPSIHSVNIFLRTWDRSPQLEGTLLPLVPRF